MRTLTRLVSDPLGWIKGADCGSSIPLLNWYQYRICSLHCNAYERSFRRISWELHSSPFLKRRWRQSPDVDDQSPRRRSTCRGGQAPWRQHRSPSAQLSHRRWTMSARRRRTWQRIRWFRSSTTEYGSPAPLTIQYTIQKFVDAPCVTSNKSEARHGDD